MSINKEKELPPREFGQISHVESEWEYIRSSWENGWHSENRLDDLENYIEHRRVIIFERGDYDQNFDYRKDWLIARNLHRFHLDFVSNRKNHVKETKEFWLELGREAGLYGREVSLEALRSMILINGAAIISSLAILTGEIQRPNQSAIVVAKLVVFSAVLSLIMMAVGHVIQHQFVTSFYIRISGILVGNPKHKKLWALPRYARRYVSKKVRLAEVFIYGSIFVFALGSVISAIILIVD